MCVGLPVMCRFIELDEGETVESVTQYDIVQAVDITSAQKVVLQCTILVLYSVSIVYISCIYLTDYRKSYCQ